MTEFNKKSLMELKKLSLEEVKKYYLELRKYEYENNIPLKGLEIRKKIHILLLNLIKIDRKLGKEKLEVINDKRVKTDKPIIYACTHIGGNDVQRTFEALKDHSYLFIGDLEGMYQDLFGFLLYLNGAICLETSNKEDRNIAKKRAIELLKQNGNLLIYPEGAWNITENLPVMKLYNGAVSMALETGAEIVPVAIEQYGSQFYVNIGKNMKLNDNDNVQYVNQNLRNNLATLKWEIWERLGIHKRLDITTTTEEFEQTIINRCPYGFTKEDVEKTRFKDKAEISADEVFAFRKKLSL